ncbi:MAG TPA: alpha/beta fold hydrolase [Acidimicrobiales bacterium]|nr:alpha/beta fold hydrolase [Acidimicrobiales bacterium]
MESTIGSGELPLAGNLSRPAQPVTDPPPALVLCHGFPAGPGGAATSGQTYPELADYLAAETGWVVLTFNFRGTGESPGDFSLGGWLDDLRAAIDHLLATERVSGVWVAGSSTGGALAICEAAEDERVRGVATLAAPATFSGWAEDPEGFLAHARAIGVVSDPDHPRDPGAWARELTEIRPISVVAKIPPRPLLLVHGSEDETVPLDDARALAEAAGETAELRVVNQAGHRLRHDPRAVAVLMGWLEQQASAA